MDHALASWGTAELAAVYLAALAAVSGHSRVVLLGAELLYLGRRHRSRRERANTCAVTLASALFVALQVQWLAAYREHVVPSITEAMWYAFDYGVALIFLHTLQARRMFARMDRRAGSRPPAEPGPPPGEKSEA